MISKYNSNNNTLFSGITKKSPTNIIFQSDNETYQEQDREQYENNAPKEKTKINNVHFGDDISQNPQEQSTRIFFPKRQRVRTQHNSSHPNNDMHRNSRQPNRYCVPGGNKHQLETFQRKKATK